MTSHDSFLFLFGPSMGHGLHTTLFFKHMSLSINNVVSLLINNCFASLATVGHFFLNDIVNKNHNQIRCLHIILSSFSTCSDVAWPICLPFLIHQEIVLVWLSVPLNSNESLLCDKITYKRWFNQKDSKLHNKLIEIQWKLN